MSFIGTLVLVDDTKANINVLIEALGDDYKLAVALDGKKAIDIAQKNAVDLILLDIMMPELDGFDVCRILKQDPATRDIPIIFITAMDAVKEKTKGFKIGAVDDITKPFDTVEVKARVQTHLHLKLAQEALKYQNRRLEETVRERTKELAETQIEILQRLGLAAEQRENETEPHIKSLTHHEKWDGTGYPRGLKAEEIPLVGRIAGIGDVFDALISKRPYKNAWSMEESIAHIKNCSGTAFDPALVKRFVCLETEVKQVLDTLGVD